MNIVLFYFICTELQLARPHRLTSSQTMEMFAERCKMHNVPIKYKVGNLPTRRLCHDLILLRLLVAVTHIFFLFSYKWLLLLSLPSVRTI